MKKLLFLVCLFQASLTFSQINFVEGYVETNSGKKINCFIKDKDWAFNPDNFAYRLTADGEIIEGLPTTVKAFGTADGSFKFISKKVAIDISSDRLDELSHKRSPSFETQTLFLKVVVEGDASLYSYKNERFQRYFYSTPELDLQQLVYKLYALNGVEMRENKQFVQQLKNNLRCEAISEKEYLNADYKEKSLKKLFLAYNNSLGGIITTYEDSEQKEKEKNIALKLKLALNNSGVQIQTTRDVYNTDIEKENFFAVGAELEYVFPFNKGKFAMFIDPFYQSYSGTTQKEYSYGQIDYLVEYSSVEVPVGLRYYMFLTDDLAVFANVSWYILDIHLSGDAYINARNYDKDFQDDLSSKQNYAVGVGLNYKRFSLETRFLTKRNLIREFVAFSLDYQKTSFILGYRFL